MSPSPDGQASIEHVDVQSLRQRWNRLAAEVGRDLTADNPLNVARNMQELSHLQAYISLLDAHAQQRRPAWRRWEFWRRVILALAILATLALLFMAFTHPSRITARLDLLGTSVAFTCDDAVRLNVGRRIETISVRGVDRCEFADATGQRVISGRDLILSNGLGSSGRLDWITIPAGSAVRLSASGREIGVTVGSATPANATPAADAESLPAIRFNLAGGSTLSVTSSVSEINEEVTLAGNSDALVSVTGQCASNPARLEATILLAASEPGTANELRLSRLTGVHVSRLSFTDDNLVTGERRSTLLDGEVRFPDIEVPHVELDEGALLSIRDLSGRLVRVELTPDGVHVVCEGEVGDVLLGGDPPHTLLPSRLEHLFARRFRMYVAGVLLYAFVSIVALLKGEKASINEGFKPHALMNMVHGGGHL